MAAETLTARCCVAGGGPAGMMLGFLLARAGIDVVVLEKHADFFRDFRGDTIHPSTLEVIYELGLLDAFLQQPHQEVKELAVQIGGTLTTIADFTHVPTHCKFLMLMPQWDFLNFIAERAKRHHTFTLRMQAGVTDLIIESGRIAGVRATTPGGALEVRADLVVGADGRHSTVRDKAGLPVIDLGAPIDVLWFRLSRRPGDPGQTLGRLDYGRMLVMLVRDDYFQCAYLIRKDTFDEIKERGLPAFRDDIALLVPVARERFDEVRDWDDIKLLSVKVDRLREWYRPGLLCIGDAAHAMSPIGGVGINLAIQDAVAAANILTQPMRSSAPATRLLQTVQRRREFPTWLTQAGQVFVQERVIRRFLGTNKRMSPPWIVRLLERWPVLRRIPAQVIGVGVRPEHVRTPDVES